MERDARIHGTGARGRAAGIVLRWLESGAFPDRMLGEVREDRALVNEMVLGVLRQYRALCWFLRKLSHGRPDQRVEAFALVGLYQLFFMDNMEPYAAVNETVQALKRESGPGPAGWLNAVLRRSQREREALRSGLERAPAGVRLSHPDLLLERWTHSLGAEAARSLCEWNNTRPDVVLRLVPGRAERDEFLRALAGAGVEAHPHVARPAEHIVLPRGVRVSELPGYAEGWFTVQDPATSPPPELLDPKPGERVLDACAAPGGKTAILAEKMRGEGHLVAMDLHEDRLARLKENLARLKLSFVSVMRGDASRPDELRDAAKRCGVAQFDAILLDVPCTNTGVIRRRPDARWRFSAARLAKIVGTQRALLDSAFAVLRPGGRLVYSTCSLEPEENESLVREWLSAHPAARLETEKKLVPPGSGTDGAYAALLTKPAG